MTDTTISWGLPAWTAPMYQPSTGMDHLGLASVSQDRILPALSPGINVLTVHPRYWSVYSWLLTEFWDRELPRTKAAWGRFLKPRERIFVAAVLSCPRHGVDIPEVAGKLKVGAEVQQQVTEFDPGAAYLKNPRGGHPIYASAIAQIGLALLDRDTGQFRCDAPTEAGRAVGEALRSWVAGTRYYVDHFDSPDDPVPADVVTEYAECICLCRLTEGPDHPLLQDAFLYGGEEDEAERRRASLRMICDISAQTVAEPVERWDFRQLVYYRNDDKGRTYVPAGEHLTATVRRWRLYQLRELQAWALNRWLRLVCEWGLSRGGDQVPIPFGEVLGTVDDADFGALASALGLSDPNIAPTDPLQRLLDWVRTEAALETDLDAPWDLSAALCEDRLVDHLWDLGAVGQDATAGILTLLVACAQRLWPRKHQLRYASDWPLVAAGGARRLSVARFLEDLRAQAQNNVTVGEAGKWLLEQYVIRQHHRVALGKLPDDTFRIRLDAGHLRFVDEVVAVEMNDSRYRALSTCATELGWTKPMSEANHKVTTAGRRLVATGDLKTGAAK